MLRHADRDVGDREHFAGKGDASGRLALLHELAEADARRVLGHAEQLAAADVVAQRRQPARLHRHEQHEARPLRRRLPQRGVAFQRRIGRLQIFVRHDAEHVVGGVVALLHPGIDVVAALDLPFVHVRRVAERFQLLGDPVRPVAVAAGIADENIGHACLAGSAPPMMVAGAVARKGRVSKPRFGEIE